MAISEDEMRNMALPEVSVYWGADGKPVIQVDTEFEPVDVEMRIHINDCQVYPIPASGAFDFNFEPSDVAKKAASD